jgi:hypothetical protein
VGNVDYWKIRVQYSESRFNRLIKICNELSDRLIYARALAAYALEMRRMDAYFLRLREYAEVEAQLVTYRFLIGQEWRRLFDRDTHRIPAVVDAVNISSDVADWV